MKSDRRHELQTNELADWVGHQIEKIAPYSKAILAGIVAVFVVAIAITLISQQQQAAAGLAWQSYLGALMERDVDNQVASLEEVAARDPKTTAGIWAHQTQAELDLDRASRMLFTNRDEALKILDRAQESFEKVEASSASNAVLLERARFGLAQVHECQGSLEKAKSKYEQVVKANTSVAFSKQATKRLETLQDPGIVEFYAWFEKQKPAPPPPRGGMNLPGGLGDLPDRPDIKFPDFGATEGGAGKGDAGKDDADKDDAGKGAAASEGATEGNTAGVTEGKEKSSEKEPAKQPESTEEKSGEKGDGEKGDGAKNGGEAEKTEGTEKPADKPAEKPAEEPAEEPAEKPAEKSAETNPEKPGN